VVVCYVSGICLASRFKGYFRVSLLFAMKNFFAFKKVGVFFWRAGFGLGWRGTVGVWQVAVAVLLSHK